MIVKYCTRCGNQLKEMHTYTEESYDQNTGEPVVKHFVVLKCSQYEEGYSDRVWHIHDKIAVEVMK